MSTYVDKASVKAEFDALHFIEALDDDRNNAEDPSRFETLAAEVDKRIKGAVALVTNSGRPSPPVQFLKNCGTDLMCALLYRRRDIPNDQNPFYEREKQALKQLAALADGSIPAERQCLRIFAAGNGAGRYFGGIQN